MSLFDNRKCESILRRMSEPDSYLFVSRNRSAVLRKFNGKWRQTAEVAYAELKELVDLKCLHGVNVRTRAAMLRLSERGEFTLRLALIDRKENMRRAEARKATA